LARPKADVNQDVAGRRLDISFDQDLADPVRLPGPDLPRAAKQTDPHNRRNDQSASSCRHVRLRECR
jgi:hypothetical protein